MDGYADEIDVEYEYNSEKLPMKNLSAQEFTTYGHMSSWNQFVTYIYSMREGIFQPFKRRPLKWFNLNYLEYLGIFIFMALQVMYMMFTVTVQEWKDFATGDAEHVAKEVGKLLQIDIALLLLPVARNSIFTYWLGFSFERFIRYHRWLGRYIYFLIWVHIVLFFVYWCTGPNVWDTIVDNLLELDIISGEIAFLIINIMLITSLGFFRRRLFEVFYKLHVLLFIPFLVLVILHHKSTRMLILLSIPGTFYALDVAYRIFQLLFNKRALLSVQKLSDKLVRLDFKDQLQFRPGQFVYLWIPKVAPLQIHPFTLSSGPGELHSSVHVKVEGRWGKRLASLAEDPSQPLKDVRVEGPYGCLSIPSLDKYRTIMFVAGGVGVTPIHSLLSDLYHRVYLRNPGALSKVVVVWSMRDITLYESFENTFANLKEPTFELHLHYTGPEDDGGKDLKRGRPNLKQIFTETASHAQAAGDRKVAVVACGHSQLVRDAMKLSSTCRGAVFEFHEETFNL